MDKLVDKASSPEIYKQLVYKLEHEKMQPSELRLIQRNHLAQALDLDTYELDSLLGLSNYEAPQPVTLEHSSDYLRVLDLTVSPKGGLETLENATLQIPYEALWPGELLGFVVATPDATRDTVVIIQMLKDNQKPEKGNLCLFEYRGDDNIARVQIAKLLEITGDSFVLIDFFGKSYVAKKVLGQEIEYRVIRKPKT